MEKVPVKYESYDGLILKGDSYGNPDDSPLILLHGGGQTRYSWGAAAKQIAEAGWHTINMDLRGHGESEWSAGADYSLDSFVNDLKVIIDSLSKKPVVAGASMGGMTAMICEGEAKESLMRALVLVDITPRIEDAGVTRIINFMTRNPEGFSSLEKVADAVASYMPERVCPQNLEGLKRNLRVRPDGRYVWHWDPEFITNIINSRETWAERLLNAAKNLSLPTLLIRGNKSDVVSKEGVIEFRKIVTHAEYVDVNEATHMVVGDQNTVFSHAVIEFIKKLP